MPFPNSPFEDAFNSRMITSLHEEISDTTILNEDYEKTLKWLCCAPKITSYRVNTLKTNAEEVLKAIRAHISKVLGEHYIKAEAHPLLFNTIIIGNNEMESKSLEKYFKEIIVDVECGAAILRGAHVYAPGVMAMFSGTQINEKVSIYADVNKRCKKGLQKLYEDDKIFLGNGITRMVRHQLFGDQIVPRVFSSPSTKLRKKVGQLKARCAEFGARAHCFEADSSKILRPQGHSQTRIADGPPFSAETFNRVLLDAPCSALGKRPQLANRVSEKVVKSYVPLQRRLFETAVGLLKVNGTLVYSTCTITLAENEGMVAWALRTFKCLKLVKPSLRLGGPGWGGTSLTEQERNCVQRFGPDQDVDSVGFFFACFVKQRS
ncbi:hypothetical protein NQ318_003385 [Aromia moschata]|uniref:SAM-dependent MTase RsmB/NOP-type domain-containing protein n=1 Tax=Aromia moschata TaxID=1265417 RepID=A0AAV8XPL8_9CUCU|nr:hypothetical protein NQ318_003385 [Aromia moschata]